MRRRPRSLVFALALLALAALAAGGSGSWAAFSSATSTGPDSFSAAPDWTAPTVTASVIAGSSAGPGVKQGGTYNLYANVTDSGNPASGVATVTANASNVTSGQTAVALSACSSGCTVGGTTYGYKSAQLTAKNPLTGTQSFTVSATDVAGNASGASSFSVTVDNTAPTVSASVIAHASAGAGVKQGGTYFVYANATDAGSGIGTVTANVGGITTGQTAVALSACASGCSVGGTSYAYKSAQLTANNPLTAGPTSYTVTAVDAAGNSSGATSFSVTVDNTPPTASSSATANGTGTTGLPEAGDKITLVTSQQLDPNSILSGWSGASTPLVVRISNAGGAAHDIVTFWNSTNTTQLPLGSVDLGGAGYVNTGATITFGATGTASTLAQATSTLTITLGTPSATANRVTGTTKLVWTSSATPTDLAGNAASGNAVTQATAVRQF
jgi:ABC-type Fe3+ transport system substrate-binding protein